MGGRRDRIERAVWRHLQDGDMGAACVALSEIWPNRADEPVPAEELPFWVCVVSATPGRGSGSLQALGNALPATEINNPPGLSAVSRLARAIGAQDWYHAAKQVSKIRHHAPDTSRNALASVLGRLMGGESIEPGSETANKFFRQLGQLARHKR